METAGRVLNMTLEPRRYYYCAKVYYTCFSDAIKAVETLDRTTIFGDFIYVMIHKDNTLMKLPFPLRLEGESTRESTRVHKRVKTEVDISNRSALLSDSED